ncbi:uncharacterized protein LOC113320115 [Papaver somniferum]|uniref:uncharacterized protein LOC113320115 n=1 Tax=Papaver somniferum TaxID=3469 RepID=UPI000E7005B5|nr:uncharacterized protein LOC113320115 [Papaver somniferum]
MMRGSLACLILISIYIYIRRSKPSFFNTLVSQDNLTDINFGRCCDNSIIYHTLQRSEVLLRGLKRLYSVPWIAKAMTWHKRAKSTDNLMRHPAGFHKASAFASEFGMQSKLHDPAPLCTGYYSRFLGEFLRRACSGSVTFAYSHY